MFWRGHSWVIALSCQQASHCLRLDPGPRGAEWMVRMELSPPTLWHYHGAVLVWTVHDRRFLVSVVPHQGRRSRGGAPVGGRCA
ncbi:hypothetical protein NDU88_000413 [Pleurodeles waltl]|uniref:Uncharacterized protein n=1 Tax=Pleurodeles waltl TaxID=8319 RepID=A0AAV7WJL8_PLEWA|nr:hypothetical protein NDU88_000413 [Pleurodeles waltl]